VKDILGVAREKEPPPTLEDIISPRKKKVKTPLKIKKPDGVSREVFALTGGASPVAGGIPPISPAPVLSPAAFKEKRKLTRGVTKWAWKPFRNSARKDGAVLYHWAKAEDEVDDYPFSRFNKRITVFEYSPEQYEKYFNDDPNWTKEETDQLWELCKMFDLRFIVIADRFSGNKSLEDIKERYYKISMKLLELNAGPEEDIAKHPLVKFPYHKEHEIARKKQYERLYHRTKEQVEEEKRLIVDYKRIEASIKKHQKEKKKTPKVDEKRKRKKKVDDAFEEIPEAEEVEEAGEGAAAKGARIEKTAGPYVRSHTILTPLAVSNKVGKKVDDILLELGVGLRPMPTKNVCHTFNELRQDIVTLLDMQKAVTQKEYQVQVFKDQKQLLFKGKKSQKRVPKKKDPYDFMSVPETPVPLTPLGESKKRAGTSLTKSDKKRKKKKKEDFL